MSVTEETKQNMEASLDHLRVELQNIRTGRANPGMLDSVSVEVYGSPMRIRDVANITNPELRQLLISPYDVNNCGAIVKAVDAANIGVRAMQDGNAVRITIPPMDEAARKEMVKLCGRKCEEGKISIRAVRKVSNELVRKQKADGDLPEDLMKKIEKDIQTLTDDFCKKADEITRTKEIEIMEV